MSLQTKPVVINSPQQPTAEQPKALAIIVRGPDGQPMVVNPQGASIPLMAMAQQLVLNQSGKPLAQNAVQLSQSSALGGPPPTLLANTAPAGQTTPNTTPVYQGDAENQDAIKTRDDGFVSPYGNASLAQDYPKLNGTSPGFKGLGIDTAVATTITNDLSRANMNPSDPGTYKPYHRFVMVGNKVVPINNWSMGGKDPAEGFVYTDKNGITLGGFMAGGLAYNVGPAVGGSGLLDADPVTMAINASNVQLQNNAETIEANTTGGKYPQTPLAPQFG
jgi:hypothetical protein